MHFIFLAFVVFVLQGCTPQQSTLCIPKQDLISKSHAELTRVSAVIASEQKAMEDFAQFVDIMKNYINDYSHTIKASAYISNALRVLPIPYAGEISTVTKLVSGSLVSLNDTASALHQYRQSSAIFLAEYSALGQNPTPLTLARLAQYGDDVLIVDALHLEKNIEHIATMTEALLSATQMIASTSTDVVSYFGRAKNFLGVQEEISVGEKEAMAKSKDGFDAKLRQLHIHIKILKNSAMKNRQSISKARVISDLI